jgi:hypothetical protein
VKGQLENVKSVVCPISEVDGTALLFLCHPLANVRELAWEVMKAVRHVNSVLPEEVRPHTHTHTHDRTRTRIYV